jgi:hypothetical protein
MDSRTDYRKLAHHHRGLYFVTPSREEVRASQCLLCACRQCCCRSPVCLPAYLPPRAGLPASLPASLGALSPNRPAPQPCTLLPPLLVTHPSRAPAPTTPPPPPLQDLYERFMELANGQPVGREYVEVAMGRRLELPRAGAEVGGGAGAGAGGHSGAGQGWAGLDWSCCGCAWWCVALLRVFWIPDACQALSPAAGGCVAFFTFDELCNRPLGAGEAEGGSGIHNLWGTAASAQQLAPPTHPPTYPLTHPSIFPAAAHPAPPAAADYIALANSRHTLALSGVPVFTAANRQSAYRFVTLVDVLYEHRCGAGSELWCA